MVIANFLYKSERGHDWTHIVPSTFFVDSRTVAGIQAVDLVAYIVNQKYCGRIDAIAHFYDLVAQMTRDDLTITVDEEEYTLHGIHLLRDATRQG